MLRASVIQSASCWGEDFLRRRLLVSLNLGNRYRHWAQRGAPPRLARRGTSSRDCRCRGQSGTAKVDYVRREGKYERGRDDLVEAGSGSCRRGRRGTPVRCSRRRTYTSARVSRRTAVSRQALPSSSGSSGPLRGHPMVRCSPMAAQSSAQDPRRRRRPQPSRGERGRKDPTLEAPRLGPRQGTRLRALRPRARRG